MSFGLEKWWQKRVLGERAIPPTPPPGAAFIWMVVPGLFHMVMVEGERGRPRGSISVMKGVSCRAFASTIVNDGCRNERKVRTYLELAPVCGFNLPPRSAAFR